MQEKLKRAHRYLIAAITWLLISTWLLTLPGSQLPKENWLDKIGADKAVHLVMFMLLTGLWCLGLRKKKFFLTITLVGIAYGIAMEFVQRYCIPNRSFDSWDIVADAAGSVAGYFLAVRYSNGKQKGI